MTPSRWASLALIYFLTLQLTWTILSHEAVDYDGASYMIFGYDYFHLLTSDFAAAFRWSALLNVITFKPPLISWQAVPFFPLTSNPKWISFFSQSVWLIASVFALRLLRPRSLILTFTLLWLSPFFFAEHRLFLPDLSGAVITLFCYGLFEEYQHRQRYWIPLAIGGVIALGHLSRLEFGINVIGLGLLYIWFDRHRPWRLVLNVATIGGVNAIILLPWLLHYTPGVLHFLKVGGIAGGEEVTPLLLLKSRLLMIWYFASLGIGAALLLLPAYLKRFGQQEEQGSVGVGAKTIASALDRLSEHGLILSGLIALAIHLAINLVTASGGEPRSRMLLASAALVITGLARRCPLDQPWALRSLAAGCVVFTYFSFIHGFDGSTMPSSFVRVPVPHRPMYRSPEDEILDTIAIDRGSQPTRVLADGGVAEMPDVSLALRAMLRKLPYGVGSDLFTPLNEVTDAFLGQFDYFVVADANFHPDIAQPDVVARVRRHERYIQAQKMVRLKEFPVGKFAFDVYRRQPREQERSK